MKFCQSIEYNMRNIFLERSCKISNGEAKPRNFSGKLKLRISLDQQSKILYSLFLLYRKLRAIIFKGFPMKQMTQFFLEGESPTLQDRKKGKGFP